MIEHLRPEPQGEPARPPGEVTRLLATLRAGDRGALDRLFPLVYDELRSLARRQLRRGANGAHGATLQATGLVHEAYLKLADASALDAESRGHFLGVAARAMRQVLMDQARARLAQKRGGEWQRTTLSDGDDAVEVAMDDMIALNDVLDALETRQRQVVEYRFFVGLEEREIADILGVTERTVRRDWVKARAWLVRSLAPQSPEAPEAPRARD
jgi:RNA polymerase sigma factor (TIGR02999 family)